MDINIIVANIIIALTVSIAGYFRAAEKGVESFDKVKFGRTLGVGAVCGFSAGVMGLTLTAENAEAYILASSGAILGGDLGLKVVTTLLSKLNKA